MAGDGLPATAINAARMRFMLQNIPTPNPRSTTLAGTRFQGVGLAATALSSMERSAGAKGVKRSSARIVGISHQFT